MLRADREFEEAIFAPPSRCLAVFVDDTGHDKLVDGQEWYGLGGCAALGRDLDGLIHRPWKEIRRRIAGSPDFPLHASKFPKTANYDDFEVVASFFRTNLFWRFGAIL